MGQNGGRELGCSGEPQAWRNGKREGCSYLYTMHKDATVPVHISLRCRLLCIIGCKVTSSGRVLTSYGLAQQRRIGSMSLRSMTLATVPAGHFGAIYL